MVGGSPLIRFVSVSSVIEQPIALADSTTNVIFSSIASCFSLLPALGGGVFVNALKSTVPLTDLLMRLLKSEREREKERERRRERKGESERERERRENEREKERMGERMSGIQTYLFNKP